MNKGYLDVLTRNLLNTVKGYVMDNDIVIEGKQEEETDDKMSLTIKELIEKCNTTKIKDLYDKHIINSLIQFYVAVYYDNVDFLYKLLQQKFNFGSAYNSSGIDSGMNLFVLDKRVSSGLGEDNVIDILDDNMIMFKRFYSKVTEEENSDELIERVCDILKNNKDIAKIKNDDEDEDILDDLFTIDLLNNFSNEEILNFNDKQKETLNHFCIENDDCKIKANLIKDYNYDKNLKWWRLYLNYFSIEEILNLSDKDIIMYDRVFTDCYYHRYPVKLKEIIEKIKSIKKDDPEFNLVLRAYLYKVLSKKQIMNLSPECADQLNYYCIWDYGKKFDFVLNMRIKREVNEDRIINKFVKTRKRTK